MSLHPLFPRAEGGFAPAQALEGYYRDHGETVYRLCRGMLPSESDAQDAVQEVFLKVLERASQFAGRAKFSTWLHRVTINHCLNRLEHDRIRTVESMKVDVGDEGDQDPQEIAERTEAAGELHRKIGLLPAPQRDALLLREIEGLSYREISQTLQIPEGTVMSRIARAREKLWSLYGRGDHLEADQDK